MNMRWARVVLFAGALAFLSSACLTVRHGNFTAASSRPVKEEAVRKGNPVRGRDCVELGLSSSGHARIDRALHDAEAKAGEGKTLIVGASVGLDFKQTGLQSYRDCAYVVGTAASPVSPDAANASGPAAQAEADPFPLVHFNTGDMGLITSAPVSFPVEYLRDQVSGRHCAWFLTGIPLNHPRPELFEAVADTILEGGPGTNVVLDGTVEFKTYVGLLVNASCFVVKGTPAHTSLLQ